jgi:hypothetical protein
MNKKISKNENLSNFDPNQISGLTFDNLRDAVRVTLVDNLHLDPGHSNGGQGVQVVNIPEIIRETEIHQVNVPVIVKELEVRTIEVPVIIKEFVVRTIEVPVVIREVQVVEIEKQIIIKEIEIKVIEKVIPVMPGYFKICMILQTLVCIGLLLTNIMHSH